MCVHNDMQANIVFLSQATVDNVVRLTADSRRTRGHKRDSPCFTLAFQQCEDVLLPNGSLDVSDDRPRGVVHELDADLGDTTPRPSSSKNLEERGGTLANESKRAIARVDEEGNCQRP